MNSYPRVLLVKFDKPAGETLVDLSYSEPIGLCYITAYLKKHGVACRMSHLFCEDGYSALKDIILDYQPEIIGFSVRNFNFSMTGAVIKNVRKTFPDIKIALGGECITPQNATSIAKDADADAVFISDGELSFFDYVAGVDPSKIAGLAYRTEQGDYQLSSKGPLCPQPSSLPMMVRDGLPMEQYMQDGFPGLKYATIHAQRGCRYRCSFCTTAARYKTVSSRTVGQILAEIDYLVETYGVQSLAIWDEDFFADIDRARGIVHGLRKRNSPVKWHTFMKLTDLKRQDVVDLLPKLHEVGYTRAVIGLESFDEGRLKAYNKQGIHNPVALIRQLSENDILLCPTFMIGGPRQSCEDVAKELDTLLSLRDIHHIKMDLPYVVFPTPFPGTKMAEEFEQKGWIVDYDWSNYDTEHVVAQSLCPPEKLVSLRNEFYKKFYG